MNKLKCYMLTFILKLCYNAKEHLESCKNCTDKLDYQQLSVNKLYVMEANLTQK